MTNPFLGADAWEQTIRETMGKTVEIAAGIFREMMQDGRMPFTIKRDKLTELEHKMSERPQREALVADPTQPAGLRLRHARALQRETQLEQELFGE